MKIALWLFVIVFGGSVLGQDLKKDISAMNSFLEELTDYRIDVEYAAGDTSDFFDQGSASVIVSGSGMFYQTDFASMIINEKNTIIVNEEERTLIYSDNKKSSNKGTPISNHIVQGIDTLLQSTDSVYFSFSGNKRVYYLRFTNSYFDLVELTFDDIFLTKVLYFYNEEITGQKGVTAVCNVHVEQHPVYDKNMLLSDFYIKEQKGNIVPTEQFTDYVLVYNESIESISK